MNRFLRLIRYELHDSGYTKPIKWVLPILFSLCVMYSLCILCLDWKDSLDGIHYAPYYSSACSMARVYFIAFFFVAAGNTLQMKQKTDCINTLMLPASMKEKFWSRYLVKVGLVMSFVIITFILVDTIVWALLHVSHSYNEGLVVSSFFSDWTKPKYNHVWQNAMMDLFPYFLVFLFHTFFVIGSAFWHNRGTIKTVAFGAAALLLMIILGSHSNILYHIFGSRMKNWSERNFVEMFLLMDVVCTLWSIANLYLAYWLFKTSTLRERKLLGIL